MKEKQNITPERLSVLVERARSGDQDAYTALYEATNQEVYRTVRSMVRNEETALDIQQDAYVFAFTHLDQLGDPAKFSPWLRAIAVNRTRSVLRKQTPVLFTELETDEGAGLPEVADLSPDASPELRLERKETADYVREILDELTVGQRMLVGMYYYEQLPVGKIAEDLGVTPGTVKTQLFRSRKKIEAAVKRLEEKGVKLCGLAPLPFLVALLKKQAPAAEAGTKVLSGALTRSGAAAQTVSTVSAAAGTAAPVVEAAAVQVGRSFFQTALGRVVLGVVAAAAIGGGVAGYRWYQSTHSYGDYQPPPTYEIELHADSDEDLTTEPAEEPTLPTDPETNEDLIPEPTEEETTEPTDPTETTEPVGAGDLTGPDPTDSTDPAPQPSGTKPTEIPEPSEADETEQPTPSTASARITDYYWGSSGTTELYDVPWGNSVYIQITVLGEEQPTVTTDNSELIRHITPETKYNYTDPSTGERHYFWAANIGKSGTGHVYCSLGGEVQGVLTLQNPVYEPCILHLYWNANYNASDKSFIGKVGDKVNLYLQVQGEEKPVLTTDNSAVAQIVMMSSLEGAGTNWNTKLYVWKIQLTGPGSAELSCTLGGTIAGSFTITAEEAVVEP